MPFPLHLRRSLEFLDLTGSKNLKTFNFARSGDSYSNKTFPFLRHVFFPYHAHCCQLQRLVEVETNSIKATRSLARDVQRKRRGAMSEAGSGVGMTICVNISSQVCLSQSLAEESSMNVSRFEDSDAFCSAVVRDQNCSTCMVNICPEVCNSTTPTLENITFGSGDARSSPTSLSDIACLSPSLSITPTRTLSPFPSSIPDLKSFSSSVPIRLSSSLPNQAPQSTPIPEPTSSSQFMVLPVTSLPPPSQSDGLTAITTTVTVNRTMCSSFSSSSMLISATPLPEVPTDGNNLSRCTVREVLAECVLKPSPPTTNSTSVNATSAPPTTPTIDCGTYCSSLPLTDITRFLCPLCQDRLCISTQCRSIFTDFCSQCFSKKRRSLESEPEEEDEENNEELTRKRKRRSLPSLSLLDPFEVMLPNFSEPFSCKELFILAPTTHEQSMCQNIVGKTLLNSVDFINVSCTPDEDPFNPCKDMLGESDGLRAAIWLVIIFAFAGNGMVFIVFIGYSVVLRRGKQDMFEVHFMYFNLAMADLLMGFYLFIIAVVDADTKGEFFLTDIKWRTGHGCNLAGFCAITSTVVSVYVLVAITIERTYTIVKVFKRKKLTKPKVFVIMGVGWLIGMFTAMLPLVGVSDYSTVAICLPFNVEREEDLAYVVVLLLVTGIAFVAISVCYIVIFQQIFCKSNKMSPVQESNRRIADAKIAIRIFILVFTNFICWFPIALLGITAAFGKSLVDNLDFARWAIVFIFPINACLNPFLYSITTRIFREQTVLLMNKCGLCKNRAQHIRNAQVGITPSYASKNSNASSTTNNGNIMYRLRSFSLVSQGSTINLLSRFNRRRSSVMSESSNESPQMATLNIQYRRGSALSSTSSEDMLSSRRGSTLSVGSADNLLSTGSTGYISNVTSEVASLNLPVTELTSRARVKISTSSLGAVPEEVEIPIEAIVDEGIVKMNPAYQEEEEEGDEDDQLSKGVMEGEKEEDVLGGEVIANCSGSCSSSLSNCYQLNVRKSDSSDGEIESGSGST